MKNKKRIIISICIVLFIILWIVFVYKLSGMNSSNSNTSSKGIISIFIEDTLDVTNKFGITNKHPSVEKLDKASELLNTPLRKVAHATVYFIGAFIIIFLTNYILNNKKYYLSLLITLLLIIGLASFDEFHQTFVDGRTGQVKDVCIDTIGGCVGMLFFSTYYIAYYVGTKSKR